MSRERRLLCHTLPSITCAVYGIADSWVRILNIQYTAKRANNGYITWLETADMKCNIGSENTGFVAIAYSPKLISPIFTARQSIALQALYMLQQIRPSVRLFVRPSVTLRYCVTWGNAAGRGFYHPVAQCL